MQSVGSKWVAGPPIESLLIKGFRTLSVQDKPAVSHTEKNSQNGKLMVLSTDRKSKVKNL